MDKIMAMLRGSAPMGKLGAAGSSEHHRREPLVTLSKESVGEGEDSLDSTTLPRIGPRS